MENLIGTSFSLRLFSLLFSPFSSFSSLSSLPHFFLSLFFLSYPFSLPPLLSSSRVSFTLPSLPFLLLFTLHEAATSIHTPLTTILAPSHHHSSSPHRHLPPMHRSTVIPHFTSLLHHLPFIPLSLHLPPVPHNPHSTTSPS